MFARTLGFAIVGMALWSLGLQAGAGGKDKEAPKDKKYEVPKNAIPGTVKSLDKKAGKFTITLKDGESRTFAVNEETEFWGPNGGDRGTGPKGLDDAGMGKGHEIHVVAKKGGKIAKDVHLAAIGGNDPVKKDKGTKETTKDTAKKDTVKKDVAKESPTDRKYQVPKDAIVGSVKAVDLTSLHFTITQEDGKIRTYGVDEKTEFWGPRGGHRGFGIKGLKDDCMASGYEIKVVVATDGKTARDVHLPYRNSEKKTEVKKGKS